MVLVSLDLANVQLWFSMHLEPAKGVTFPETARNAGNSEVTNVEVLNGPDDTRNAEKDLPSQGSCDMQSLAVLNKCGLTQ